MTYSSVPFNETDILNNLALDYINNEPQVKPFYQFSQSLAGVNEAAESLNYNQAVRPVLVSELTRQYQNITMHPAVQQNINKLLAHNTYTITTGHQLSLFTGPLFFVYKICSAINLAAQLNIHYPDKHFVPLYWMATEDHDFEEVNNVYVNGETIAWQHKATGATGRMQLNDIAAAVKSYTAALGAGPHLHNLAALITQAYTTGSTFAQATRSIVNALFSSYGLIVLDADSPALKQFFVPTMQRELETQFSHQAVEAQNAELQALGYPLQVTPRHINLFYLTAQQRERIVYENDEYQVLNTTVAFTPQQLITELHQYPERFSPNVILRPVYQQVILPNPVYIGGGGELSYWLQLKQAFRACSVTFPVLMLRNSFLILTGRTLHVYKHLQLPPAMLFQPVAQVQKYWLQHHAGAQLNTTAQQQLIQQALQSLQPLAQQLDATMEQSLQAHTVKINNTLQRLQHKFSMALKRKHSTAMHQVTSLHQAIYTQGTFQERKYNIAFLYNIWGADSIGVILRNTSPFSTHLHIIQAP